MRTDQYPWRVMPRDQNMQGELHGIGSLKRFARLESLGQYPLDKQKNQLWEHEGRKLGCRKRLLEMDAFYWMEMLHEIATRFDSEFGYMDEEEGSLYSLIPQMMIMVLYGRVGGFGKSVC